MSAPRLRADLLVAALIRQAGVAGASATVVRRGVGEAGDILLKLNDLSGGFEVLGRALGGAGEPVWMRLTGPVPVAEAQADALIARRLAVDPDLWIVEIEDRQRRHFADAPVA